MFLHNGSQIDVNDKRNVGEIFNGGGNTVVITVVDTNGIIGA